MSSRRISVLIGLLAVLSLAGCTFTIRTQLELEPSLFPLPQLPTPILPAVETPPITE